MKANLVIIEDDTFIRQMYSTKIEDLGIGVLNANNIDELKSVLEKNNVDLILLDLVLPNVSGFDILKWLKKNNNFNTIPVIVLSNLSSQSDVDQAFELGAVDYIIKSNYTPAEVIRTIQKYLNK